MYPLHALQLQTINGFWLHSQDAFEWYVKSKADMRAFSREREKRNKNKICVQNVRAKPEQRLKSDQ